MPTKRTSETLGQIVGAAAVAEAQVVEPGFDPCRSLRFLSLEAPDLLQRRNRAAEHQRETSHDSQVRCRSGRNKLSLGPAIAKQSCHHRRDDRFETSDLTANPTDGCALAAMLTSAAAPRP